MLRQLKDKLKAWFPFLAPLRRFLQVKWFYLRMRLDGNRYARGTAAPLPEEVFSAGTLLLNENSGHDMAYQRNKVDNLKLAAATVDGIVIRPGRLSPSGSSSAMPTIRSPIKRVCAS